jgi:hypothetical protein
MCTPPALTGGGEVGRGEYRPEAGPWLAMSSGPEAVISSTLRRYAFSRLR